MYELVLRNVVNQIWESFSTVFIFICHDALLNMDRGVEHALALSSLTGGRVLARVLQPAGGAARVGRLPEAEE